MGAAGGARGGGDENLQDYNVPGGPTEAPDERRRWWKEGARPKDPYRYDRVPQDDKDTLMSTFPKEKSGLPSTSKGTAETSFIQGMFLQLQKKWEQWRSSDIFPTWITVKLKCGTYQKKEEG